MLISELLNKKQYPNPDEIVVCDATDKVSAAVARMADHDIGAVVIRDDTGVVGIFTERDVIRGLHREGTGILDSTLGEHMITKVIIVSPEQGLDEALDLMNENRIRHLPVVDKDQLVGMLSIRDLFVQELQRVKSTAEFLQQQVQIGSKPLPM
ncbi:MAG: CBS domain-containing protein [Arenicellales bacterium]|nr:CBS domain-containing protein [Arenicellales bacterium]